MVKISFVDAGDIETQVRSYVGRSPGGGHENPLWHSCLEIPKDKEAW